VADRAVACGLISFCLLPFSNPDIKNMPVYGLRLHCVVLRTGTSGTQSQTNHGAGLSESCTVSTSRGQP
jgi:hypothetical protein